MIKCFFHQKIDVWSRPESAPSILTVFQWVIFFMYSFFFLSLHIAWLATCGIFIMSLCRRSGDRGEGASIEHRGHWQEEVPGPRRHYGGSVHDDHQETHPAAAGEGHLHVSGFGGACVQVRNKLHDHTDATLPWNTCVWVLNGNDIEKQMQWSTARSYHNF